MHNVIFISPVAATEVQKQQLAHLGTLREYDIELTRHMVIIDLLQLPWVTFYTTFVFYKQPAWAYQETLAGGLKAIRLED